MASYSIKDLESISGIKAHTLRIWEQRYNLLDPKRTETNIRYYTDEDLKFLLNVVLLNKNGYKISQISKMGHEEMNQHILKLTDSNFEYSNQLDAMVIAMVEFDEDSFEKILSTNILRFGFERTMFRIVYPFLNKMGVLWQTGSINISHEHFATNIIKQKLIVAIDAQMVPKEGSAAKFVLYLPENEWHEIGLLFSAYVLKSRGNRIYYLGQNVPLKELIPIYEFKKPDYIYSIFTASPARLEVTKYLQELSKLCPESTILISGSQISGYDEEPPANVQIFQHMKKLLEFIDEASNLMSNSDDAGFSHRMAR